MAESDGATEAMVARLESLGARTPPPLSTTSLGLLSADRLEPRTLVTNRRGRRPVLLPIVAVAAVVLGVVMLASGGSGPDGQRSVVLGTATDAVVELGGRRVPLTAGQSVPEGSTVVTGANGAVTVDGRILGPGERAVVRRGRLERLARQGPGPGTEAGAGPGPGRSSGAGTGFESVPTDIDLTARRDAAGAVVFRWEPYGGVDFGAYLIVREDRHVVDRRVRIGAGRALDRGAPSGPTRYVLVVFDDAGHPVARSQIVTG